MILGTGGVKMSKSLGNVVNPDDIIKKFGADTLRMYEMFIGPFDQAVAWDDKSVIGIRRFVDRVYALQSKALVKEGTLSVTHKTIKKVGEDIETMSFNTAISALMICLNTYEKEEDFSRIDLKLFLQILAPFAPFIAEELWKNLGETTSIHQSTWPMYDQSKLMESEVIMSVQINGKLRGTFVVPFNSEESVVVEAAKNTDGYKKYVENTEPKKIIVITNRLVNIVI